MSEKIREYIVEGIEKNENEAKFYAKRGLWQGIVTGLFTAASVFFVISGQALPAALDAGAAGVWLSLMITSLVEKTNYKEQAESLKKQLELANPSTSELEPITPSTSKKAKEAAR